MKKALFRDLAEDYGRLLAGPMPKTNQSKMAIDSIAEREPKLAALIHSNANQ